jgi:predicted secreted Zn-dependent protease
LGIAFAARVDPQDLRDWNVDEHQSLRSTPAVEVGWTLKLTGRPRPTATPERTPAAAASTPAPFRPSRAGAAGASLVTLPELTVTISGASVTYVPVEGNDPDELLASAAASVKGLRGHDALADLHPTITFDVDYDVDPVSGSCTVASFSVDRSYVVVFPQWSAPSRVRPSLVEWWQGVIEHAAWHAGQHVTTFERSFSRLEGAMAGVPCEAGQDIIDTYWATIEAESASFDTSEADWAEDFPYAGPLDHGGS